MKPLFVQTAVPRFPLPKRSTCPIRPRILPCGNINQTSDSAREDEIAAKIARLRSQNRLQSQAGSSSDPSSTDTEATASGAAQISNSFDDLPDWKKEELMQSQIIEAESFLNPSKRRAKRAEADVTDEQYKPKVSTWGVFPRPDNISNAFGGGKKIQPGGVNLSSEEALKRDEAVKEKLIAYRKARGIDTAREEDHRDEIDAAVARAELLVAKSRPYEAIKTLQSIEEFVSDRSRLGGTVYLSLALAYDSVGKRDEAKELYRRLRRNSFPEIAGKAKQLFQGFEAMEMLNVDDETSRTGLRVTEFRLPDVNSGTDKRYETALSARTTKSEPVSMSTNILLLALIAGPIAFVLLVLGPARR